MPLKKIVFSEIEKNLFTCFSSINDVCFGKSQPLNMALYNKIKNEIHQRLESKGQKWGAYTSMELVKKYKQQGGRYAGDNSQSKLKQWIDEKWTDQHGRECGAKTTPGDTVKYCRPEIRVNRTTPVTRKEMSSSQYKKALEEKKSVGMGKTSKSIKRNPLKKIKRKKFIFQGGKCNLQAAPGTFKSEKPLYRPYKSDKSNKKGMVYVMKNGSKKIIYFGDSNMQDFTQHHDEKRNKNYCSRSGGITNAEGNLTKNNKNSANYWARSCLWNC